LFLIKQFPFPSPQAEVKKSVFQLAPIGAKLNVNIEMIWFLQSAEICSSFASLSSLRNHTHKDVKERQDSYEHRESGYT
jgi:hypothetical protein